MGHSAGTWKATFGEGRLNFSGGWSDGSGSSDASEECHAPQFLQQGRLRKLSRGACLLLGLGKPLPASDDPLMESMRIALSSSASHDKAMTLAAKDGNLYKKSKRKTKHRKIGESCPQLFGNTYIYIYIYTHICN